tara:strand:+ start:1520 stop:1807 length:288 start_codon:yes stop_codon:yes gene_type:complete
MALSPVWARGSVDVFYFPQIVDNGGLKFEGGVDEPLMHHQLTSMLRPQEIQVGGIYFRREVMTILCLGTRSGAEASNPTGDSGCLGIAELRRLMF